jgi:hypothetical protein
MTTGDEGLGIHMWGVLLRPSLRLQKGALESIMDPQFDYINYAATSIVSRNAYSYHHVARGRLFLHRHDSSKEEAGLVRIANNTTSSLMLMPASARERRC